MKIAFIVPRFPTISETFILNQIIGMIQMGHDVRIFTMVSGKVSEAHEDVQKYHLMDRLVVWGESKKFRFKNTLQCESGSLCSNFIRSLRVTLRSLNVMRYGRRSLSLTLARWAIFFLGEKPFDVYHCHFGNMGNVMADLREIGAIQGKLITTFHGYDMNKYVKKFGRDVYNRLFNVGDLFLPISNRWRDRLIEMGCNNEKIVVHRMGIDLNTFDLSLDRSGKHKTLKILTVGRLVEKKGIEYGVRGVGEAIKTYPNIEYTIVGDGPLREHIAAIIRDLNLEKCIKMVGSKLQAEVRALMKEADVFLCPSVTSRDGDQEGIPVVLMEAMATGLPVISTFHSGIPELVQDGETGFLVNERDVIGLAEKICLLTRNSGLKGIIGINARNHIEKFYDIEKLNRQLIDLFTSLE